MSRAIGGDPTKFRNEGDEMRREIFLEMRQIAPIKLHAGSLACRRQRDLSFIGESATWRPVSGNKLMSGRHISSGPPNPSEGEGFGGGGRHGSLPLPATVWRLLLFSDLVVTLRGRKDVH